LEKADQEIDINIRGPMHLAIGFLEHFKKKEAATIVNVSSVLGFIPFSIINPVYNGTKAWMHFWSMNLRTQLAKEGSKVKIVEIVPPTVSNYGARSSSSFHFGHSSFHIVPRRGNGLPPILRHLGVATTDFTFL
jgi:hypothetical protein